MAVEVTVLQCGLFLAVSCFASFLGVSIFPACGTEGCIVLQLEVGDHGFDFSFHVALVIERICVRRTLNQRATWTTVSVITLASPVFVAVPSLIVGSEVNLLKQFRDVLFVLLVHLLGFGNSPVVRK